MKKLTKKKLALGGETLRSLEAKDLGRAQGGISGARCSVPQSFDDCSGLVTCHSNALG